MKFRYGGRQFDLVGVDENDHIHRFIRDSRGFYEIDLLEYLRFVARLSFAGETFSIDVGANIGNHSVFFGSFLGASVVSVEPNPRVLPILRRNLEANRVRYELCELAVGAAEGTGTVVLPTAGQGNVGMARVEVTGGGSGESVAIRTLDSVVADARSGGAARGRALFLKIDVEGAEMDVLRGATRILRNDRPHVLVEAATDTHRQKLSAHLESFGYEFVTAWGWHATPMLHFSHQPARWFSLAARAYQLSAVPRYVGRAGARRIRAALSRA